MAESYVQVNFYPIREDLSALEAYLMAEGYTALEIHDPEDIEELKANLPKWELLDDKLLGLEEALKVTIYVPEQNFTNGFEAKWRAKWEAALKAGDLIAMPQMDSQVLKTEDWQNGWKNYYKPIQLSRFMAIIPVWEEASQTIDVPVKILLDPGLAFGTGSHPTTKLCLLALEEWVRPGDTLVDVGCGSGILSIAGAALGAGDVYSYDIDPNCEKIVRENASLNVNADRLHVATGNLLNEFSGQADLIVANILAGVLEEMAPAVPKALKAEGRLIISGFLTHQVEQVCAPFEEVGLKRVQLFQDKDWCCVIMDKEED